MRNIIILDLDETVTDFLTPLCEIYSDLHHPLKPSDIDTWDFKNCADLNIARSIWNSEGFFASLKPLPNSIEVIKELWSRYEILIATKPETIHAAKEKYEWCQKYLPFIPFENINMTAWKWLMFGDYIIDDNETYLNKFIGKKICIDRPYNQNAIVDYRVKDWLEIKEILLTKTYRI